MHRDNPSSSTRITAAAAAAAATKVSPNPPALLRAPLVRVASDAADDVRPQQRLAVALDDKVHGRKHQVRVAARAAEPVARRRGELRGPHARHLLHQRERADLGDVRRVRPPPEPEARAEQEVGVLERPPLAVCGLGRDLRGAGLEPRPAEQPEDEAKRRGVEVGCVEVFHEKEVVV